MQDDSQPGNFGTPAGNAGTMPTTAPFKILTVCTGNICRSPMVERLLQHGLEQVSPGAFEVSSAGTRAMVGHGIEPRVAAFIRDMAAPTGDFASRQLTSAILAEQDLVIALTRAHRSSVVELRPAMLKKTFTLRELARILPHIAVPQGLAPAERWEVMIPLAMSGRSLHSGTPENDDVVDPYRRSAAVYEQMRKEITPAVQALVALGV